MEVAAAGGDDYGDSGSSCGNDSSGVVRRNDRGNEGGCEQKAETGLVVRGARKGREKEGKRRIKGLQSGGEGEIGKTDEWGDRTHSKDRIFFPSKNQAK